MSTRRNNLPPGSQTDYILNKLKEQQKEINRLKVEIDARDHAIEYLKRELSKERKHRISLQQEFKNWNRRPSIASLIPTTSGQRGTSRLGTPRQVTPRKNARNNSHAKSHSSPRKSPFQEPGSSPNRLFERKSSQKSSQKIRGLGDFEVESLTDTLSTNSEINAFMEEVIEESRIHSNEGKESPKRSRKDESICRSPNYAALLNALDRSKIAKSPKSTHKVSPQNESSKFNIRKETDQSKLDTQKKKLKEPSKIDCEDKSNQQCESSPHRSSFKWTTVRDEYIETFNNDFGIKSIKSLGSALCKDYIFHPKEDNVKFGIKILDTPAVHRKDSYILIGVAQPNTFGVSDACGMNEFSWAIDTCFGQRWHQGLPRSYYDAPINVGDIVDVSIHRGRISFNINGEQVGTAYRNVSVPVCPCVTFLGKGYEIEVVHENTTFVLNSEKLTKTNTVNQGNDQSDIEVESLKIGNDKSIIIHDNVNRNVESNENSENVNDMGKINNEAKNEINIEDKTNLVVNETQPLTNTLVNDKNFAKEASMSNVQLERDHPEQNELLQIDLEDDSYLDLDNL